MRIICLVLACSAYVCNGRRLRLAGQAIPGISSKHIKASPMHVGLAAAWQPTVHHHEGATKDLRNNHGRSHLSMSVANLQDVRTLPLEASLGVEVEHITLQRTRRGSERGQKWLRSVSEGLGVQPLPDGMADKSHAGESVLQRPEMATIFEVSDVMTAHEVVTRLLALPDTTFHAVDTEVAEINIDKSPVGQGRVICISIYSGPEVDYGRGPGHALWVDTTDIAVLEAFRPFLECERVLKVWHNYGFDRHVLWNHGIDVRGFGGDTLHMSRLWDASRMRGYSLETLTDELVGRRKAPMKELFGVPVLKKDGTPGKKIELPPVEELQINPQTRAEWIGYSAYDAQGTWLLHSILSDKLKNMEWQDGASLYEFYARYWRPFGELLTDMEREGIEVDASVRLPEAEQRAKKERDRLELKFRRWAASWYPAAWFMNPSSGQQIATLLFGGEENQKTGKYTPPKKTFKMERTEFQELLTLAEQEYAFHVALAELDAFRASMSTSADPHIGGSGQSDDEAAIDAGEVGTGGATSYSGALSVDALKAALLDHSIKLDSSKFVEIELTSIGLDVVKKTKKGAPATDAASLSILAGRPFDDEPVYGSAYEQFQGGDAGKQACEALAALVDARGIEKILNTFLIPLQENADKYSRIHCSLNLNTETGRLSSRSPNLQNQPALEKDQYKVRKAFRAGDGKALVVADYGQLELRLLAHMCSCRSMIDAFKAGGCFHSRTAMGMFDHVRQAVERGEVLLEWDYSKGQPTSPLLKDVYGSERRKAKTLNFSIAYGKTVLGLSKDWRVSVAEAQSILESWYADRPEVRSWQSETIKTAHEKGWTRTLMGRYRLLPGIKDGPKHVVQHLERASINTPIQGGAADIMTLAMLKIQRSPRLMELGYKLLLQIHDEVILEGPEEYAEAAKEEVVACMVNPYDDAFPGMQVDLVVDAKTAKTWFEAK